MGSRRLARNAGMWPAAKTIKPSAAMARPSIGGSWGIMPKSLPWTMRVSARDEAKPATTLYGGKQEDFEHDQPDAVAAGGV